MSDLEQSGFSEFARWLALAQRTRELLDAAIADGGLPAGGADYLADRTLPHVEGVQAGFIGWLRTDGAGIAELRYLLGRVASMRVDGPATDAERRGGAPGGGGRPRGGPPAPAGAPAPPRAGRPGGAAR